MLTATYGESVTSTPMYESCEPSGPMLKGTTYIVRPRIAAGEEPVQLRAHLGGVHPVVRGPGVGLALGADEGAVLDPGDVARVGRGPVRARPLGVRSSSVNVPASTSCLQSSSYSSSEPSNQWTPSGWQSATMSSTQSSRRGCVVGAAVTIDTAQRSYRWCRNPAQPSPDHARIPRPHPHVHI